MAKITRQCLICQKDFIHKLYPSTIKKGKYCSHPCYAKSKVGNTTPWNKGKTSVYSHEHLRKMSETSRQLGLRPPSQSGVKQSAETIAKRILKGADHWNWQGGITDEIKKRVNSASWHKLRKEILDRDHHTCQHCGKNDGRILQVNHIIPYRFTQDDSPDNLETLCISCHTKADSKFRRIKTVWSGNVTG